MKKFHPILFSTPMVQAILEGRKTMTRRTKGLECVNDEPDFYTWCNEVNQIDIPHKAIRYDENYYYEFTGKYNNSTSVITTCPYGKVGDILWVRETWQYTDSSLNMWPGYVYRATDPDWETYENWTWKPSIFMPKAACRIFLKITNVGVERLQIIGEEDIYSEGITNKKFPFKEWQRLWQKINGVESWEANPFVWVIEFKKIEKPENFC